MVTQKGRVAAEIQSADELVLSELIFNANLKVIAYPHAYDPHYNFPP